MFLEDDEVLSAVAITLKKTPDELVGSAPYWAALVQQAHVSAYQDVVGRLLARGFSKGQVDAWDRGAEFERDLTVFWALTRGGMLEAFSDLSMKPMDRRKELDTVQVFVRGVYINPDSGQHGPGLCSYGSINDARMGIFNGPAPPEGGVGEYTEW